ncbi:MAG: hypothetical protein IKD77_04495 [Bacilli bacterium]|nr:hypothetical protein [Bacilli bacterium]
MNTTKLKEKPMPVIYTTEDICKIFHIGRVKCLELFQELIFQHRNMAEALGLKQML